MKTNVKVSRPKVYTHNGAIAAHISPLAQLRRSVLSCLLFESEFYEDGVAIADRIIEHAGACTAREVSDVAIEARTTHNLRHVPLLLCVALARKPNVGRLLGDTVAAVVQRADELTELVSLYWKLNPEKGKAGRHVKHASLPKQFKVGLARAFGKFDGYQLAKYNRDSEVKLRDVLFLCHAKPASPAQGVLWKHLIDGTLKAPDTWEVNLSAGADKGETFTRLLVEKKLGYFALLRNLRNMVEAGVSETLIKSALAERRGAERILPFRFTAAARACPRLEPAIDAALCANIEGMGKLPGKTVVMVDVSGSMDAKLSAKSDLSRRDAAATLASVISAEDLRVFTFSQSLVEVPPRRGMAGVDAINRSQPHGGTALIEAVRLVNAKVPYDRLIVISDEQANADRCNLQPVPAGKRCYMINVASAKNGVGYGSWTHLDGFSEGVLRWIAVSEKEE